MSLNTLRKGQRIKIGAAKFLVLQKLPDCRWQLQNTATGEWCAFAEDDLLDRFVRNELSFTAADQAHSPTDTVAAKLTHGHPASLPPETLALARSREQYLKEMDRRQPITITKASMDPLIRAVADRIRDVKPPSWITLWRNYRRWVAAGRDVRAIALRYADRGNSGTRILPEVLAVSDQVINELYMTAERRRVPEVYLEIVRRLEEANEFRPEGEKLPIPSRSTIFHNNVIRG
jgi:putative transposase